MNTESKRLFVRILLAIALAIAITPAIAEGSGKPAPPPAPASPPADQGSAPPEAAPEEPTETEDAAGDDPFGADFDSHHPSADRVAVMSDIEVAEGQTVPGGVVCIGGTARIKGHVRRDVVVIAGKLEMSGTAGGDVAGVASRIVLEDGAAIRGDLVNVGGALDRGDVKIGGQTVNIGLGGWAAHFPSPWGMLGFFLFWLVLLKLLLVFVALLLISVFVPSRVQTISTEIPLHPLLAFFAGLGGYILLALVILLLAITIIGIPAAILVYFAFVIVKWIGLAGLFHFVGQKFGKGKLSILGAVLLGFLPFALLRFLPFCVGGFLWFVIETIAFGYVILTRIGGRPYVASTPPPVPPMPPMPPMPKPPPAPGPAM